MNKGWHILLGMLFLLLLSPSVSHSQTAKAWMQSIHKAEEHFEQGNYEKAEKRLKKLIKRQEKKAWMQELIPVVQVIQAKSLDAQGDALDADVQLWQALLQWENGISERVESDTLKYHTSYLIARSLQYFGYTKYALTYLDQADSTLNKQLDPQGMLLQRDRQMRLRLLLAREDFNAAAALIDLAYTTQDGMTVRSEMRWNEKKQVNERKRVKASEYRERALMLADFLQLRAQIQLEQGNWKQADSLITENHDALKFYIKTSELPYVRNQKQNILLLRDYKYKDDLNNGKMLRKLRQSYASRMKYAIPNVFYYDLFEEAIDTYLGQQDFSDYRKDAQQYKREAVKNFSRSSTHFLHAVRLEIEEDLHRYKYSKGLRKALDTHEKLDDYFPVVHQGREPFYWQLAQLKIKSNDYTAAASLYNQRIDQVVALHGDSAPVVQRLRLEKALFDTRYAAKFEEADSLFSESFETYVREQLHSNHHRYLEYLNGYANLFQETDRFDTALVLYREGAEIAREKFTEESEEYAHQLVSIASVLLTQGKYADAELTLEAAVNALKEGKSRGSVTHLRALRNLGSLYLINGKLEQAQQTLRKAVRLSKRLALDEGSIQVNSSEELAKVLIKAGRYDDAENLLLRSAEIKTQQFGPQDYRLIEPYNALGSLYLIKGDFVQAEKNTRQALEIAQENLSDTSLKYVETLTFLADVYYSMGDYEKSLSFYDESIRKTRKKFGDTHLNLSDILIRKAKVQIAAEYPSFEVIANLDTAAQVVTRATNDMHPKYAEAIELKAQVLMNNGQFDEALTLLEKANTIYAQTYGEKHLKTADNRVLVADLYYLKREYPQALSFYELALKSYANIFDKLHPRYVGTLSRLGKTHYASGDYKSATKVLDNTTAIYLAYIRKYFPALSENEKANYWNTIRPDFELYNSLVLNYHTEKPALIGRMYENKLATKALLLNSSIKIKERIMASGDETLIARYETWGAKREQLTRALSMTVEEQKLNDLNPKQLQREITLLEKELSESTEGFAQNVKQESVSWKDVRNSLYEDEAAIEIIQFNYFTEQFTDSVVYVALVVKEDSKQPELVVLPKGNDLEGKFFKYYRNSIKFKSKDKYSYKQFWAPIDEVLSGKKNLFVSADGVYNQLNPETFLTAEGTYLIDQYNFFLVSNTKELATYNREETAALEVNDAVLIGNPEFSTEGDTASAELTNKVSSVEPLPGAEEEVKELSLYLAGNEWETETYLTADATERRVKEMNNPRIFHVATHGFFMQTEGVKSQELLENEVQSAENPLLKSGLLFTGADELLSENNVYQFNRKDGILTAYEAMNLQLDNTELVVLSACETGLGEVRSGEGVYGLQRSFLVAGAQNVIMTLFKVNDQVTQELMNTFYRQWLETGDKRAAFLYAKREIKKKYESPIYWGSFVMIGLD